MADLELPKVADEDGRPVIDTSWHPLVNGCAPVWASGWGQDPEGVFIEFTYRDIEQRLRWIPRGRFLMGSPEEEAERYENEGPQVEITFTEGFWLFDTAVTQELYDAVMGETPSHFTENGKHRPVETVSWHDAQAFMDRLNGEFPGLNLRLPSEAEWEYACRAGSITPFEPAVARSYQGQSITPDEVNYDGNYPYGEAPKGEYRQQTVPVKGRPFRPNAWGLWHMPGNVWECCEDVWNDSHDGADISGLPRPRLESEGTGVRGRVARGGSWGDAAGFCRAACRVGGTPGGRGSDLGFRPARGQEQGPAGSGSYRPSPNTGKLSADAIHDVPLGEPQNPDNQPHLPHENLENRINTGSDRAETPPSMKQPSKPDSAPTARRSSPKADDFRAELQRRFTLARDAGERFVDLTAGEIHRAVGDYPGPNHRMPSCCNVMRRAMKPGDNIIEAPPRGNGASLKIRYHLTR